MKKQRLLARENAQIIANAIEQAFGDFDTKRFEAKKVDASGLSSSQRSTIEARLNRGSFFSARITNEKLLDDMKSYIQGALAEESGFHRADFVEKMQAKFGFSWDSPAPFTGITNIVSTQRLELIYNTQKDIAQGEAEYELFTDPDIAMTYPCMELVRWEWRKSQRDWKTIWKQAGGKLYRGRMIATRNDPIWTRISDFGNPYPPFKYNSGMWTENIDFEEAVSLGVIDEHYIAPANEPLDNPDDEAESYED